eukprot:3785898-Prymnesium_polylepis.1
MTAWLSGVANCAPWLVGVDRDGFSSDSAWTVVPPFGSFRVYHLANRRRLPAATEAFVEASAAAGGFSTGAVPRGNSSCSWNAGAA